MYKLSPSILAADFANLGQEIKEIRDAGADYCHIDVMDGTFVPNIALGIPELKSIRKSTDIILDVHLMIDRPERYIEEFASAGADIINFHYEATTTVKSNIDKIKSYGKKAGLTIKPDTDPQDILEYLQYIDLILIMSVYPGFGGQKFMAKTLDTVRFVSNFINENNLNVEIEIDGGITMENVVDVLKAGGNVIVAGSSVFNDEEISKNVRKFYQIFNDYQIKKV